MFFREIRWKDAAKMYERNEPFFFLPYGVLPIMVGTIPQKRTREGEVSFLAILELQVVRHGKTTIWTEEGSSDYSGDKCYEFIVSKNHVWYHVVGMWKDKEDAEQELSIYGYEIVGE